MMTTEASLKVFVLSNPAAADRRRGMADRLAKLPELDWTFFDIVPPERLKLKYSDEQSYLAYGSVMSSAEISCAASHLGMMEAFLADPSSDYLMVLEDDVFLDPNFNYFAAVKLMQLTQLNYLKLFARYYTAAKFIASFGRFVVYRSEWPPFGIQSYILSRKGATQMLSYFKSVGQLNYPVDVSMDTYWATGLPVVMIYPFPALELALGTTIHGVANRAKINLANAECMRQFGPRPTKAAQLEQRVRRVLANQKLRGFDKALARLINENCDEIHKDFSSNLARAGASPSGSNNTADPPT
jgi:glycosyl transferase family 25